MTRADFVDLLRPCFSRFDALLASLHGDLPRVAEIAGRNCFIAGDLTSPVATALREQLRALRDTGSFKFDPDR